MSYGLSDCCIWFNPIQIRHSFVGGSLWIWNATATSCPCPSHSWAEHWDKFVRVTYRFGYCHRISLKHYLPCHQQSGWDIVLQIVCLLFWGLNGHVAVHINNGHNVPILTRSVRASAVVCPPIMETDVSQGVSFDMRLNSLAVERLCYASMTGIGNR